MRDQLMDLPDELLCLILEELNYYSLSELSKTNIRFKKLNAQLLDEKGAELEDRARTVHVSRNRRLRRLLPVEKLIQFGKKYPIQPLTSFMQMHYPYGHRPMMSNERLNELALILIKMIENYQSNRALPSFYKAADAMNNYGDKTIFLCFMVAKVMGLGFIALDSYYTFGILETESKPSGLFKNDAEFLLYSRFCAISGLVMNFFNLSGYTRSPFPQEVKNFEDILKNFVPKNDAEKHYQELLILAFKELIGTNNASLFKGGAYWTSLNQRIETILKPMYYIAAAHQAFTWMPLIAPFAIITNHVIQNEKTPALEYYGKTALYLASFAYVAIVSYQYELLDSMTKTYVNGKDNAECYQVTFKLSVASTLGLMSLMALYFGIKFGQNPSAVVNQVTAEVSSSVRGTINNLYGSASSLGFWFQNNTQSKSNVPIESDPNGTYLPK